MPLPNLMTLEEVADELRVSYSTIREWRRRGLLPVLKLPTGTLRVRREDLEELLRKAEEDAVVA